MSDPYDTAPASSRVVVVEDDPLQAESLAFILRQEGYVVDVAATGAEALAIARTQPAPDTVLLDVALPDLSGIEVARRLRAGSNRSEEHTSELQSQSNLVCRLLLEK